MLSQQPREHLNKHLSNLYYLYLHSQSVPVSAGKLGIKRKMGKTEIFNPFYSAFNNTSSEWCVGDVHNMTPDTRLMGHWDILYPLPSIKYRQLSTCLGFLLLFDLKTFSFLHSHSPLSHLRFTNHKFGEECSIETGSMSSIQFTDSQ